MNAITRCDHEIGDCVAVEQTFRMDAYRQADGSITVVGTVANKIRCTECGALGLATGETNLVIPPAPHEPHRVTFRNVLWLFGRWILRTPI